MDPDAVQNSTAVFIRTSVAERRKELVQEVTVSRMNLYSVESCLFDPSGCILKFHNNLFDFCPVQLVWEITPTSRVQNCGRSEPDCAGYFLCCRAACMIDLHHTIGPVLMNDLR